MSQSLSLNISKKIVCQYLNGSVSFTSEPIPDSADLELQSFLISLECHDTTVKQQILRQQAENCDAEQDDSGQAARKILFLNDSVIDRMVICYLLRDLNLVDELTITITYSETIKLLEQ